MKRWAGLYNHTDFTEIRHLGTSASRPFFRCTRDVLGADQFVATFGDVAARHGRIAIIGNQLAGKTTLLKMLGPRDGFTVLDDCNDMGRLSAAGRLVLADYRACRYLDDFDVIFNVLSPPRAWEAKRDSLPNFTRSSGLSYSRLSEFYSVAL